LDRYILSKLRVLVEGVSYAMDDCDIVSACADVSDFLEILNNWYIRRSRSRFWDGQNAVPFNVLYTVLTTLCKVCAPLLPLICEYMYRALTGEESVHLADWADVSKIERDDKLVEQMDFVRLVCRTAKSVREENKLRNRLPLASMTVAGLRIEHLPAFRTLIEDEVNVKELIITEDITPYATHFLYVFTPLVGKRLGQYMKDILTASKTKDWSKNPDGTLSIAGQTLNADEFELRLVLKEGLTGQALPDNTAVVLLDTDIRPELEKEGAARDIVRIIQSLRKDKDLNVSDRIKVIYQTDSDLLKSAISAHQDYIMDQVLAVEFASGSVPNDAPVEEAGDGQIRIWI
jgi:isoleucyl-tRNA synthetase